MFIRKKHGMEMKPPYSYNDKIPLFRDVEVQEDSAKERQVASNETKGDSRSEDKKKDNVANK